MFTTENCRVWAREASDAFVANNVPLGDTIASIAKKNHLNPNQMQRVIELTNSITHARLFKSEKDKTFTFKLAKLDEVLEKAKGDTVKEAQTYVAMPEIKRNVDSEKIAEMFGNPEISPKKGKDYTNLLEKMACASKELNNALIMADVNAVQYLKDVKTVVKQLLLDNYSFDDLFATMIAAMPEKKSELLTLFTDISKELQEEGVKLAHAVDPELISKLLNSQNVKVINGQHPLYLTVNNHFEALDEAKNISSSIHWLGKKIDELKKA
jgi:hypothetical protein